jgi:hypothetical protein
MFRKFALATVAAASLGAIALSPTAASAHIGGFGGGKFGGGFGGFHHHWGHGIGVISVGVVDDGCYVTRTVLTPFGYRLRTVNVCY